MTIGFVGLGHLGTALAQNLLAAGYSIEGFDIDVERRRAIAHPRFRPANSLHELGRSADVLITCVVTAEQLEAIIAGETGLGPALRGKPIADLSTLSVDGSARVASHVESHGGRFLRATVSGNPITARTRDVSFVCSGPADVYDDLRPMLEAMGKRHRHVGAGEQARVAKLATNLVVGSLMVLLAEAVAYGERGGLDPGTLMDILADSAIGSPFVVSKRQALAERDFTSIADISLILKDLELAGTHARQLQLELPVTDVVTQRYEACTERGWSRDDMAAVLRLYEDAPSAREVG